MIKINLLPAYVLERHLARRTAIIVVLVLVAQLAALGFAVLKVRGAMAEEKLRVDYWTKEADKVSKTEGLTQQVVSQTGPYQSYVDFVANVALHHRKWAWLYEEVSKWVDSKVVLSSMNINGTNVQLQGATDSLDSAKRWYLNTMTCFLYSSVQLSVSIPSWQPPTAGTIGPAGLRVTAAPAVVGFAQGPPSREQVPVSLACSLKPEYVITPPAPPGGAGQVAGGRATATLAVVPTAVGAPGAGGLRFFGRRASGGSAASPAAGQPSGRRERRGRRYRNEE